MLYQLSYMYEALLEASQEQVQFIPVITARITLICILSIHSACTCTVYDLYHIYTHHFSTPNIVTNHTQVQNTQHFHFSLHQMYLLSSATAAAAVGDGGAGSAALEPLACDS